MVDRSAFEFDEHSEQVLHLRWSCLLQVVDQIAVLEIEVCHGVVELDKEAVDVPNLPRRERINVSASSRVRFVQVGQAIPPCLRMLL